MSSNYQNIDRPYDNNVSRDISESTTGTESTTIGSGDSASTSGGSSSSEQGSSEKSTTGTDLSDIYLKTWIKSRGYTPKTAGFLLDGAGGYIECMQLYVGTGGIVGGKLDIPDASTTNSFHVDANGNIWSGATSDNFATAPFSVANTGTIKATLGTIGGWALTDSSIYYNGTGTPSIKTAATVGAGSTGVILDSAGLRGYDSVLGKTFDLPVDGSAPSFASGVITSTSFAIDTAGVIRTSDTVGDGTASSAGILINNTGLYGCQASQTLANANIKVLVNGTVSIRGAITADSGSSIDGSYINSLAVDKLTAGTITSKTIDLAVSPGTGDTRIAAGKTDFTNIDSGFILGIDDSDSDLSKFYIGNNYNYLNWDGEAMSISGYNVYDAIVDPFGTGSYSDLKSAIEDGKRNIFLKPGYHILPAEVITTKYIQITGEDRDRVIVTRPVATTSYRNETFGVYHLGDADTAFDVTNTSGDTYRYTWTGIGVDPRLSLLKRGNRIYISGSGAASEVLSDANADSFILTAVGTDYFEVTNASGVAESNKKVGYEEDENNVQVSGLTLYDFQIATSGDLFDITNTVGTTFRYTWDDTSPDPYIEERIKINDYVWLPTSSNGFNNANCGIFKVTGVGTKYFEITNANGVVENNVEIGALDSWYPGELGDSTTRFDITNTVGNYFRYTWDGTGTDPQILHRLTTGCEIEINAQNFSSVNNGKFVVSRLSSTWFEVFNKLGTTESDLTIGTGYIKRFFNILGDATTELAVTNPSGTTWRYTYNAGTDPNFDQYLAIGDEVEIDSGTTGSFAANNEGKLLVTAVAATYFETSKAAGTEETKVVGNGYMFFHPGNLRIYNYQNVAPIKVSNVTFLNLVGAYGILRRPYDIINCVFNEKIRNTGSMIYSPLAGTISKNRFKTPSSICSLSCIKLYGDDTKITENVFEASYGVVPIDGDFRYTYGDSTTQFDITNTAGTTYRYTYDGTGTNPNINTLFNNRVVYINGQNFNAANNGYFEVTDSGTNYFEVSNTRGVAENNKTLGTGSLSTAIPLEDLYIENNEFYLFNANNDTPFKIKLVGNKNFILGNYIYDTTWDTTNFIDIIGRENNISGNLLNGGATQIKASDFGKTNISNNIFKNYHTYGVNYSAIVNNTLVGGFNFVGNNFGTDASSVAFNVGTLASTLLNRLIISNNNCKGGTKFIDSTNLYDAVISNNVVSGTSDTAFDLDGIYYSSVNNNLTQACDQGFLFGSGDYCTITGNISHGNTNVDSYGSLGVNCENVHNIFKTA